MTEKDKLIFFDHFTKIIEYYFTKADEEFDKNGFSQKCKDFHTKGIEMLKTRSKFESRSDNNVELTKTKLNEWNKINNKIPFYKQNCPPSEKEVLLRYTKDFVDGVCTSIGFYIPNLMLPSESKYSWEWGQTYTHGIYEGRVIPGWYSRCYNEDYKPGSIYDNKPYTGEFIDDDKIIAWKYID